MSEPQPVDSEKETYYVPILVNVPSIKIEEEKLGKKQGKYCKTWTNSPIGPHTPL